MEGNRTPNSVITLWTSPSDRMSILMTKSHYTLRYTNRKLHSGKNSLTVVFSAFLIHLSLSPLSSSSRSLSLPLAGLLDNATFDCEWSIWPCLMSDMESYKWQNSWKTQQATSMMMMIMMTAELIHSLPLTHCHTEATQRLRQTKGTTTNTTKAVQGLFSQDKGKLFSERERVAHFLHRPQHNGISLIENSHLLLSVYRQTLSPNRRDKFSSFLVVIASPVQIDEKRCPHLYFKKVVLACVTFFITSFIFPLCGHTMWLSKCMCAAVDM